MKELSIPETNVLRHYDIVNKTCPAPYVHNNGYKTSWTWEKFKAKLSDSSAATGTQATEFLGLTENQAAEKIIALAQPIAERYKLLPSVLAAQAVLESGYCKTELAQKANNVCGMKSDLLNATWVSPTWTGGNVKILTTEYDSSGTSKQVTENFRKYKSIEDCMEDRCAFFTKAKESKSAKTIKYAGITACRDYRSQITLIKERGYATDPAYVDKICNRISKYNRNCFDAKTYVVQAGVFAQKINAKKYAI